MNDANAQVISMSLGITNVSGFILNSDGTDKWEQKADWAARNGAIFVKSAGNEGDQGYYSITSPGTAKNVIAVGATNHWYREETNVTVKNTFYGENIDDVTNYSSRGDTGDNGYEHGRDKPEVVAPGGAVNLDCTDFYGDGIVSARGKTDNQSSYLPDVNGSCSYKNNNLYRMVGTSMAAPHVSGMAALIIDNYNFNKSDRNASIVKAMIVGSGINIGDNDRIANHTENHVDDDIGYGKVDLYQAIGYNGSTRKNWYFGNSLNSSGAVVNYTFTVPGDNTYHYIKATVVWNDPPTTTTVPDWGALKNDIDIELKDANGTLMDSSNSWQQNIEQINYYNSSGIASGNWTLQVKSRSHWDSAQEFGGFINLYTDKPSVNVRAFSNKSNVSAGDKIQITATVNNTGGEVASGVIVSLNLTSPPGRSIYDNFTMDSGYEKTLLGNIPPLSSRTVSWNLTVKNSIPETTFSINATYSNTGSTTNGIVTLNGNSISGWDYRKQKTINGTTAGAQTNYQMKLTVYKGSGADTSGVVYLGGNARDDFGDLRFTKSDGVTLLDYWIESYTSGVSAVVWVEVDSIPTSPNTASIYIYYCNPSSTSSSSSAATFMFFDDFNDLNNWVTDISPNYGESLSASVSNSEVSITTSVSNSDPKGSYAIKRTSTAFNPNVAIRTRYRDNTAYWYPGGFGFGVYPSYQSTYNVIKGIYTHGQFMGMSGKNGTLAYSSGIAYDNTYYVWDLIWTSNKTQLLRNGASLWSNANSAAIPTASLNMGIGDMGQYGGGASSTGMKTDWILVRNCVNPEPAWI